MKKDSKEPWEGGKVHYWQGICGVTIVQHGSDATFLLTITWRKVNTNIYMIHLFLISHKRPRFLNVHVMGGDHRSTGGGGPQAAHIEPET